MIVGTAGHIDHGKTTLVRALTGVDTDRLPEEKQRGISIELGYAFLDVPAVDGQSAQRIGFIDVPGHERLVHTMLAGATGIDFALLLVAADDGVMPQTREHLAVLSLLGLDRGAVAVTKCDRVDAQRLRQVEDDVRVLLADTPLADAPILAVSATAGTGLEALRQHLLDAATRAEPGRRPDAAFRLAIDRCFSLSGAGTVVTGTVHAGAVRVGDELTLLPGLRPVRVRSVHAQNQSTGRAQAGQRCALALAGIDKDEVARGQWVTSPAAALQTDRIDVHLTLWQAEARALRTGTPVQIHIGAAAVVGTVALLDADTLPPGATARAQLVLRAPVGAWRGDRVVLRDASATRTLAGGLVLDPHAPARYRRTPQRLAELDALALADPSTRLVALLAVAPQGVDLQRLTAAEGGALGELPQGALRITQAQGDWALGAGPLAQVCERVLLALHTFHARYPDELGPDSARLRRLAVPRMPEPLWRGLLASLQQAGSVVLRGAFVHLPDHGVRLSVNEQRIAQKVAPHLADAGSEGAWVRDLARLAAEPEPLMRSTLARLAQAGDLHQVVKDLYLPPVTMAALAAHARRIAAAADGVVLAAAFRDATGLGRKRAIQILEYLDRVGLTRRVGDTHKLRVDSTLFASPPTPGN